MHSLGSLRLRLALASALVAAALALGWAWAFEIPLERALVLAPALVVGVGLLAMVGVLLARAALESIRASGHPRLVLAAIAGIVGLGVVLTILGIELPRE
jgi:hypothetical protein